MFSFESNRKKSKYFKLSLNLFIHGSSHTKVYKSSDKWMLNLMFDFDFDIGFPWLGIKLVALKFQIWAWTLKHALRSN